MTIVFIIITCIISVLAFNNDQTFSKLQFSPYLVYHRKQYYRLLSHGFVHADWMHLFFNMLVLYFFGTRVESIFNYYESEGIIHYGSIWFTFMYIAAIIFSSVTTLKKHKDNPYYNAVGASGAVSAVLFSSIFFDPWAILRINFFIPIPAIIFGVGYLIYSQYMSKRNADNINHDAHFVGAVFGFFFPLLIKVDLIHVFIDRLLGH